MTVPLFSYLFIRSNYFVVVGIYTQAGLKIISLQLQPPEGC